MWAPRSVVIACATAVILGGASAVVTSPGAAAEAAPPGTTAPVATIRSPIDGSTFVAGAALTLVAGAMEARDPAAALTYRWDVLLLDPSRRMLFSGTGSEIAFPTDMAASEAEAPMLVRLVVSDEAGLSDTATVRVHAAQDNDSSYPIGPGDALEIIIYAGGARQEEFGAEVSAAGTITCPLVGDVGVMGLRAHEVSTKLTEVLGRDFFVNPQVLVSIKDYSKKVYVAGEVRSPGAYGIKEGLTALNACTLAGGFTDYAQLSQVLVTRTRNGRVRMIKIDLTKVQKGKADDLILQSGDRVEVPHRIF